MNYFIDLAYDSLNKRNEELCGDKVEVVDTGDSVIIVLADGLGSGVKANILATMTTKIAGTMLKEGASVYETIETIAKTLPVCHVRKLAYSTFVILKIGKNGIAQLVEYDNPPLFYIRNNRELDISKKERMIHGKKILESEFEVMEGDSITIVSDGVIHAGVGGVLNLGWQWENVLCFLLKHAQLEKTAKGITNRLMNTCIDLYEKKPGDDTTVVSIKIREPEIVSIFAGPPENKENDSRLMQDFMAARGVKVVCGGTATNIASRELGEEIEVLLETGTEQVPPIGKSQVLDLVTEGVITLSCVLEKLEQYVNRISLDLGVQQNGKEDGAYLLTKMLINDCTHVCFYVGQAINPAHQNPDLPKDLSIKLQVIKKIKEFLETLGKEVTVQYY